MVVKSFVFILDFYTNSGFRVTVQMAMRQRMAQITKQVLNIPGTLYATSIGNKLSMVGGPP